MLSGLNYSRIKFRTRLLILSGTLIAIIIAISSLSLISMSIIRNDMEAIYFDKSAAMVNLSALIDNLHRVRIRVFDALVAHDILKTKQLEMELKAHTDSLLAQWGTYKETPLDIAEWDLVTRINSKIIDMVAFYQLILRDISAGSYEAASKRLADDSTSEFRKIATPIRELIDLQKEGIKAIYSHSIDQCSKAVFFCVAMAFFGLLFAIGVSVHIFFSITRPLNRMISGMESVAGGNLQLTIGDTERTDEIGALARTLVIFRQNAVDLVRLRAAQADILQKQNATLQDMAYIDPLTSISNRRCFDDAIIREWERCRDGNLPISIILIDIDYFKLFNDHYGHQEGDQCLKAVASCLSSCAHRNQDLVARYGGEEFVAILPHENVNGAIAVANKMLECVRSKAIPHAMSSCEKVVTVSIGISTMVPSVNTSFSDIVERADRCLYVAKNDGRNRYHSEYETSHDKDVTEITHKECVFVISR